MSPSLTTTTTSSTILLLLLALPFTFIPTTLAQTDSDSNFNSTNPGNPADPNASFKDQDVFEKDMLVAHNFYRNAHGVPELKWNDTSADAAGKWARGCRFVHSGGPTGENLAAGYANATAAVDAWGLERKDYNFKKPGFGEKTGHFTQLVWGNTTSVGCAVQACEGENDTPGYYVVCEYFPPGNVVGNKNQEFKDNVPAQEKGKKTDTVESGVSASSGAVRNVLSAGGVLAMSFVVAGLGAWVL